MNWRPIETAPKDGTAILAYPQEPYTPIEIVRWHERDNAWIYGDFDHGMQATHWMPLPSPPSTEPAPQDTGGEWEQPEYDNDDYGNQWWNVGSSGKFRNEAEAMRTTECWNLLAGHDLSQVAVVKKEVVEEALQALRRAGGYAHFADAQETVKACKEAHDKLQASLNAGGADE